jgi:dipeptidyl aminopeptidase/acylaminoacyl peptidase
MTKEQQACGTWSSLITAEMVAGSSVRYASVQLDGDDIYWLEGRPDEQGRTVIVRRRQDRIEDVLPPPWNARSRVHEYGGGAFAVHDGRVWFVNDADQQVYEVANGQITQQTNEPQSRYADLQFNSHHQCLYAVREDHALAEGAEPCSELVRISGGVVTAMATGDDFYAAPAVSPDGRWLAWLSWNHPDMPWDRTILWLTELGDHGEALAPVKLVDAAGQSVFQPAWSADGKLYFVNDPTGWWQLYRFDDCENPQSLSQVCDYEAEMGLPLWQFGMQTYVFQDPDHIIATLCEQGLWRLARICTNTGEVEPIRTPYNSITALAAHKNRVVLIAAGSRCTDEVSSIDLQSGERSLCTAEQPLPVTVDWVSEAQPVCFETSDDDEAHGFYYPPYNPKVEAVPGELPPLLVMTHGGPTSATSASLSLRTQFWTSRGFAVLDVNYRGSTGYGRGYREHLNGHWGIYDVDDVVAGARYLVELGKADPNRLIIRGGSAGGFTTLAALTFTDVFHAGASYYGIGDLQSLLNETHKFEARYLDRLIGPYPERQDLYQARSPIMHVENLSCPVIFMQGEEDKVVPPQQARSMAAALRDKGVYTELILYAGEQHGFRRAATIIDTLQSELAFYQRVFKL